MTQTPNLNRLSNQLQITATMLNAYDGDEPFHLYLARFFRTNKKFGSGDRRFYRSASYAFWRYSSHTSASSETILQALLGINQVHPPAWTGLAEHEGWILPDVPPVSVLANISNELSNQLSYAAFENWFRQEPPVYLLPFPGMTPECQAALTNASIHYEEDGDFLKTGSSPVIQLLIDQGLCRIQDKGSSATVRNLPIEPGANVWDCCSGAGGKSLTIQQYYDGVTLTCSDNRPTILPNLLKRFQAAGFAVPETLVVDLVSNPLQIDLPDNTFDVVLLDLPCSGSGTWRHNPEQAHFFDSGKLEELTLLQKGITTNTLGKLKTDGILVYITCSVFRRENEENVAWLTENPELELLGQEYLGGSETDADYFFRAIFKKTLC